MISTADTRRCENSLSAVASGATWVRMASDLPSAAISSADSEVLA